MSIMSSQPADRGGGMYLKSTRFIDSDRSEIIDFARQYCANRETDVERAIALYEAVRDGIKYDAYRIDLRPEALRASSVLARGSGFCVSKAILLAAAARAVGIPSRLGFADVKNHMVTERLRRLMQTDLFVFHGYTQLLLDNKWVSATPAFNRSLCEHFDVAPLEFDGRSDSVFQQFDRKGNRYMEYVHDRGLHADVPRIEMLAAFREHYPSLMSGEGYDLGEGGSFEDDATTKEGGRGASPAS